MQLVETLLGEVLAGLGKHELGVADAQFFLPAGVEKR
jgi:hypothetical protein